MVHGSRGFSELVARAEEGMKEKRTERGTNRGECRMAAGSVVDFKGGVVAWWVNRGSSVLRNVRCLLHFFLIGCKFNINCISNKRTLELSPA